MTIMVPCDGLVEARLLGRRIRVETPEFSGYGEVKTVFAHQNDHMDDYERVAEITLEVDDGEVA